MKNRWIVSIRNKIFSGCLFLTFVTIVVGVLLQNAQIQLSDTARGLYDNAFVSMSYLRSAQAIVLDISSESAMKSHSNAVFIDQLQSAMDALDVARERAMSTRGADHAKQLQADVSALQKMLVRSDDPPVEERLATLKRQFDIAVQVYASDGLRVRNSVQTLLFRTRVETYTAMAFSVMIAIAITFLLSGAIVPSINHSVEVATRIASGKLDNAIQRGGSSETGILLTALAAMQDSIAEKISFIETLLNNQASHHAAEIALQHARFEVALNNMTMGLCMFDASGTLLVHNCRFMEMFALTSPGSDMDQTIADLSDVDEAPAAPGEARSRSFNRMLDDGRTIAISEKPMEGGARVVTYEDITERRQAEARLAYMAHHDTLTGLPNRVLFREEVERGLLQARRGGALSVMCIDLDRFKDVNDTLGHPIGDALLCQTATRLLQVTGDRATVVRLGGDEFAIIQYAPGREDEAKNLTEELCAVMNEPFTIDGHHISISASIGVAQTFDGQLSPDTILKNADVALYYAKADGRNTYRFFEGAMDVAIHAKRGLEIDLRAAIEQKQLELYYQPLINAQTGLVVAFEALLRWHHRDRGFVPPTEFIALAEETGLIQGIGRWVINQACRDASAWPSHIKVAVNLSPLQFRGTDLVSEVASVLLQTGLAATRLEIEITESLMLQDTAATLAKLHELRALGIRVSMDDFGTGYSSLSYLRLFPFDKIKIDRSFVSTMRPGSDGLAIVESVIALGRSLRIDVVAEGVETDEQKKLLCDAGCRELQGYLFSPPRPLTEIGAMIQRFSPPQVCPAQVTLAQVTLAEVA